MLLGINLPAVGVVELAIALRRKAGPAFKLLAEMRGVPVAEAQGDYLYGQAVIQQQQLGLADNQPRQVLARRFAVDLPEHAVAVGGAVPQLRGNVLNAGSPFTASC